MLNSLVTVLVVEDNPGDVVLIREMLADATRPFEVLHANRLSEATAYLEQQMVDVILLDLSLPDSVGMQTFQRIDATAPDVPIVVMTGLDDEEFALETAREGAQDYLVKGHVDTGVLVRAIRYAIERKRYETELVAARQEAEKMNRLKSAFLANMSHEIRTPLTGIIGFAAILAEEVAGEQQELAQLIQRSGQRLMQTLNSVLDLSMLESDSLTLNPQQFPVREIVEEVVEMLRPLAEMKELTLEVVCDPPDLLALTDRGCIDRILTNLVGNAIKFTVSGGVTVWVTAEEEGLRLGVTDTGIGISQEFLQSMFEPFEQESSGLTRAFEGNGLGLAITKGLVDMLGGILTVESAKERGSTFSVLLPNAVVNAIPAAPWPTDAAPMMLVVEDNEETRILLKHLLRKHFEVTFATNREEALAEARAQAFNLILMDINLGDSTDGIAILHTMRQEAGYAACPIIAMTAYALPGDEARFLSEGFDAYLAKPFTRQQLEDVLGQVIGTEAAHHGRNPRLMG